MLIYRVVTLILAVLAEAIRVTTDKTAKYDNKEKNNKKNC